MNRLAVRLRSSASAVAFVGLIAGGCSVSNTGLGTPAENPRADASASSDGGLDAIKGAGGPTGTGGAAVVGVGGTPASGTGGGSLPGTGGAPTIGTEGGAPGGGGATGIASAPGTGGSVGIGGVAATGGAAVGTGGAASTATGGASTSGGGRGSGGAVGTGGTATGGRGGSGGRGAPGGGGPNGTCNATTCPDGCCNAGMCVTNRNDQRCGTSGRACAPCDACYQCSDAGACDLDPVARWMLTCSSATVAAGKLNGQPWDTGFGSNMPDPFCQVTSDGMVQVETPVLTDTVTPMWNRPSGNGGPGGPGPGGPGPGGPGPGSPPPGGPGGPSGNGGSIFTASSLMSANHRWQIAVIDDDGPSQMSDSICALTPQLTANDFNTGMVVFPSTQSCLSLTIQLVCAK